jgi:hypothetical protein
VKQEGSRKPCSLPDTELVVKQVCGIYDLDGLQANRIDAVRFEVITSGARGLTIQEQGSNLVASGEAGKGGAGSGGARSADINDNGPKNGSDTAGKQADTGEISIDRLDVLTHD